MPTFYRDSSFEFMDSTASTRKDSLTKCECAGTESIGVGNAAKSQRAQARQMAPTRLIGGLLLARKRPAQPVY
jgi:hypothetical protein